MRVDLHLHTTASDGCWPPARLIDQLQRRAIGLFSVTDHDEVGAIDGTRALAAQAGLRFVPGVEVSCSLDGTSIHVLGYGIDVHHTGLLELLERNRTALRQNSDGVVEHLAGLGLPVDVDAYRDYTYDRTRGGWRALNFLIDQGLCTDARDYFRRIYPRYLGSHGAPTFGHPAEAAAAIRAAGGVPIWAHPGGAYRQPPGVTEARCLALVDAGVAGLECYTSYHDEALARFCLDFCRRHDLLITGGSDNHGGFVPRELGVPAIDESDLRLGPILDGGSERG